MSPKSDERQMSMLRPGGDYEASGSTRDIHELQAALQAAQLTATDTGPKYSGTQKDCYLLFCFKGLVKRFIFNNNNNNNNNNTNIVIIITIIVIIIVYF